MSNSTMTSRPEEIFYVIEDEAEKRLDSTALYADILINYPHFSHDESEIVVKRCFIDILRDEAYMSDLLLRFDITIEEFISLIYKEYGYIFSPYYINKVKAALRNTDYD